MSQHYKRYILPFTLAVLGLLLLLRVTFGSLPIQIGEEGAVVALLVLVGALMVVAIHLLVRISMGYLRELSVRQARRDTLTEHRRFLERLDHELKNPLTALRAGLGTLSLTDLDPRQQQLVHTMKKETGRLSRLVADLRKLTELEVQPLNLQVVDVDELVNTVVRLERQRFDEGKRKLTLSASGKHMRCVADPDLLALALHNLLDNAFKYTRPGDEIRLEVIARHELVIRVRDTGHGIRPADLPHVWEELYRAQQTEKVPGSGIGLALVKAIVERHHGEVAIESEPEIGTTVSFYLPSLSQP